MFSPSEKKKGKQNAFGSSARNGSSYCCRYWIFHHSKSRQTSLVIFPVEKLANHTLFEFLVFWSLEHHSDLLKRPPSLPKPRSHFCSAFVLLPFQRKITRLQSVVVVFSCFFFPGAGSPKSVEQCKRTGLCSGFVH